VLLYTELVRSLSELYRAVK